MNLHPPQPISSDNSSVTQDTLALPAYAMDARNPGFLDSAFARTNQTSGSGAAADRERGLGSSLLVDVLVYLAIVTVVLAAWQISRMGLFKAGDRVGYWIGFAGAMMMLLLFSYPLRKHFHFARNWGPTKGWLMVHMMLGVGGPFLILLHSTFSIRSLNAAVAFYSMLVVAISGVVGRFIYARVNRGLHGEKVELRELQTRAGLEEADARSRLAFAPAVEVRLIAFEQRELQSLHGWFNYTRQVFWLPLQQWLTYYRCTLDLRGPLRLLAQREQWAPGELLNAERKSRQLVWQYLHAVTRVAQFTAYARFFSLWHVAHSPFVYMLLVSAVVHVIAVHAY